MKFVEIASIALLSMTLGGCLAPAEPRKTPDCSGAGNWAATMAFVHLKNAGLTNNDRLDFASTKTELLASERIGQDLYRQVNRVTFTERSGNIIEVITRSDASNQECSMSGVEVYVVSKNWADCD